LVTALEQVVVRLAVAQKGVDHVPQRDSCLLLGAVISRAQRVFGGRGIMEGGLT
jgi:hypothetical protein